MTTLRVPLTEETPCNLCGASDYHPVSERDREGNPLRTTICRRCGLVWTNPRPTVTALDEYYRHSYRTDYKGMPRPTPRKLVRGLLGAMDRRKRLLPVLRPGARVLDVGCGAGEFVFVMRNSGFDASGLEPDAQYSSFAREVLRIPVDATPLADASYPPESFDAVTMFHVLEHVADPRRVLSSIAGWLKRSGLVLIEVPNVEGTGQAPHHRFHFAHLFSFSPATLTTLAVRAGLAMVRIELTSDGGNIVGFFRKRYPGLAAETGVKTDARAEGPAGEDAYQRTMAVLRSHTAFGHYLTPTPYSRAIRRLLRRLREDQLLRRLKNEAAILQWAKDGVLERA